MKQHFLLLMKRDVIKFKKLLLSLLLMLNLSNMWGDCMSLDFEFDELCRLVEKMGFKGSDMELMVASILHTVNKVLRSEVYDRSTMP